MSIFSDIADQWQIAENAFSDLEIDAFSAGDEQAFDAAGDQKKKNDQAYFLFLFTRFEESVTSAVKLIITNRTAGAAWVDRRIWQSWSGLVIKNDISMHFLAKLEVLIDKSRNEYGIIKSYYEGRNRIAHGGIHSEQFFIPEVASKMENIAAAFPSS